MTDTTRDLIQRLVDLADALDGRKRLVSSQGQALDGFTALANFKAIADEARACLDQSKPEGPTDEEIMALMPQQMHEDLAYAVQAMAEQAGTDSTRVKGAMRIILNRHSVDLARAVLARWGRSVIEPAQESEGQPLARVEFAKQDFNCPSDVVLAKYCDDWFYGDPGRTEVDPVDLCRGAIRLFAQPLAPVPITEHLPEPEDCNDEGEVWAWRRFSRFSLEKDIDNSDFWCLAYHKWLEGEDCGFTHWLPHWALRRAS